MIVFLTIHQFVSVYMNISPLLNFIWRRTWILSDFSCSHAVCFFLSCSHSLLLFSTYALFAIYAEYGSHHQNLISRLHQFVQINEYNSNELFCGVSYCFHKAVLFYIFIWRCVILMRKIPPFTIPYCSFRSKGNRI